MGKPNKAERFCLNPECQIFLDPEWADPRQRYCSRKCQNRRYYLDKGTPYHKDKYAKEKKAWKRSSVGERANVAIRRWLKLPDMFK